MMTAMQKGLVVALAHMAIVTSVGGRLLLDRQTYPRAWARTAPVDPSLPIRGRYVRLRLEATTGGGLARPADDAPAGVAQSRELTAAPQQIRLTAIDGQLVALPPEGGETHAARVSVRDGERVLELVTPVAFFIPPDVDDPSRRPPGEELWVEVTVPPNGPPRPIRLGVKRGGVLVPLELR